MADSNNTISENEVVEEIVNILTRKGMTIGKAKEILNRVESAVEESSENFIERTEVSEVFRATTKIYKKRLRYENGSPSFR